MTKLDFNSYYNIKLISPWNKLVFEGQIVGMTSADQAGNITPFDVRGTYFTDEYGVSISDYYRMVLTKPIYIVNKLKTRNPIELSGDMILVPEALVDFNNTTELKVVSYLSLAVSPVMRYSDSSVELEEMKQLILKESVAALETFGPNAGDNLSGTLAETLGLLEIDIVLKMEKVRADLEELTDNARLQYNLTMEQDRQALLALKQKIVGENTTLQASIQQLAQSSAQMTAQKDNLTVLSAALTIIQSTIQRLLSDVVSSVNSYNDINALKSYITTNFDYNTLYQAALAEINGG